MTVVTVYFNDLHIDELTVSLAYSIQHFLGAIKAYIV